MKSKEIVNEGLSPVLYHATTEDAVMHILSSDEFKLSQTEANVRERHRGSASKYEYYMSFSRSRSNGYVRMADLTAIITVDGRRLGSQKSGSPIDYYNYYPGLRYKSDEMEDRVLSHSPTIENAHRYLKLIEILIPSYWADNQHVPTDSAVKYYERMVGYADHSETPVYFYLDRSAFLSGNRRKAMSIVQLSEFATSKKTVVTEQTDGFNNWTVPSDDTLKREYKVEIELKGRDHLFLSEQDFIDRVKSAPIVSISASEDRMIKNRSRTRNKEELIDLVSSYRSWPEFRNMKTVDAIYQGFENNSPMELPIVIKQPGRTFILTGNTRMDIAFQMGVSPKVIMVEL